MAHMRSKRAIQFIPLLIGLGIMTGKRTGIGGTASSAAYYNQLSVDLTNDIEQVTRSILIMQDQLTSLASVVSPNQRGLNLLTAKKGRVLTFLKHRVLFYVNQMEIVRDMSHSVIWPLPHASTGTCVCMYFLNAITNFISSQWR
jgi:hypothetical protein